MVKFRFLFLCLIAALLTGCDDRRPDQPLIEDVSPEKPELDSANAATPPLDSDNSVTFSFAVVPQFGTLHFAKVWQPLIRDLEARTSLKINLIATPSIPDFETGFSEGRFDFAYMNPYHYICAKRDQGYQPLLRDQSKQLKGILVVREDSEIEILEHLHNAKIAFPAPNALGASLYLRALLDREHGIAFTPVYVNSHDSVYLNVVANQTIAGGGVKRTLSSQRENIQKQLRVIYETPGVAPHPIVFHPRVKAEIAKQVFDAIVGMSKSATGRELLGQVPLLQPGPAIDEDYQTLTELNLETYYVAPDAETGAS